MQIILTIIKRLCKQQAQGSSTENLLKFEIYLNFLDSTTKIILKVKILIKIWKIRIIEKWVYVNSEKKLYWNVF